MSDSFTPVDLLSAEKMIDVLHECGDSASSDYNDAEEVQGWFWWRIEGDVLSITHEADTERVGLNPDVTHQWRLVPIEPS